MATSKKTPQKKRRQPRTPRRSFQQEKLSAIQKRVKVLQAELDTLADELAKRSAKGAGKLLRELRPHLRDRSHSVYVVELDKDVREDRRFAEENSEQLETGKPCLYVGMTSLDPELRFENHRKGVRASRYVRKFGLRLRPEFYLAINPMTREEAEGMEKGLAVRLRQAGYPTRQN